MPRGSVVFLNRFYWPDVAATAQMLTDLAEGLAAAGWDVTVVTGATDYSAATSVRAADARNGVRIIRVRGTSLGRERVLTRAVDQGTYLVATLLRLLRMPPADLVVAMSDPPLILPIAVASACIRGHGVVYWLQDLYPHLAAGLGVLSERGVVYRAWAALARRLYARCAAVVALGPAMARAAIAAGAPESRTLVVSNWADTDAIRPLPRAANARVRSEGLADKFVVLYSGNAGRAHTFDAAIGAAMRLRDDPDVVFLFVGGGARVSELERAVARERLGNVRFHPYVPRDELRELLSTGSVGLVTEDPRAAGLLLPSKIYGILAAGLPVLFVGAADSDVATIVHEADCGYVIDPRDVDGFVAAIGELRALPAHAAELGRRARMAAETRFGKERATAGWDELLLAALARETA